MENPHNHHRHPRPIRLPNPYQWHRQPPPNDIPRAPHAPLLPYSMQPQPYGAHGDTSATKIGQKRVIDYTSSVVRYMQVRMFQRASRDITFLQRNPAAAIDMLPCVAYLDNPSTSFTTKFVHAASVIKNSCSVNQVSWTSDGRRLVTGYQSGVFALWDGQSFCCEMILQAHEQAVRSMVWSYNGKWMVTGDDGGTIKYWESTMNNVKANNSAHTESVCGLRTDLKFCSCSDDRTVKVWDFARCQEEHSLSGHGWDVKCVEWHPTKSLLVSGGRDNIVKLWDAKSGRELRSFHGHKKSVLCTKWNQNGNWVLTASMDQIIKLYDIRAMKELESFRQHSMAVTALAWHPFHEEYFVSGSFDGSIFHWLVGHDTPQVEIPKAHDKSVWDLAWHPIGYILCSGGNDHATKFWCRNRPDDQIVPGPFQVHEPSTTPGPFGPGHARNEPSTPGIEVAMPPFSFTPLTSSNQGGQNMSPSHLQLQHPHLPRPPPQMQPRNMASHVPSSMPGSMGGLNQMIPPFGHGHLLGNQMYRQPRPRGGGVGFIRPPQAGQMPMRRGRGPYQSGNPNASGRHSNFATVWKRTRK